MRTVLRLALMVVQCVAATTAISTNAGYGSSSLLAARTSNGMKYHASRPTMNSVSKPATKDSTVIVALLNAPQIASSAFNEL